MDPDPFLGNLCCYFRLKTKTLLFNRNTLDYISAERLITGFHICQMLSGKQVGQKC